MSLCNYHALEKEPELVSTPFSGPFSYASIEKCLGRGSLIQTTR